MDISCQLTSSLLRTLTPPLCNCLQGGLHYIWLCYKRGCWHNCFSIHTAVAFTAAHMLLLSKKCICSLDSHSLKSVAPLEWRQRLCSFHVVNLLLVLNCQTFLKFTVNECLETQKTSTQSSGFMVCYITHLK